jgi:hypothetical protein
MGSKEWFKGNLHTHTTKSDGDETPEKVCEWFEKHEYDFLVLSDHNHLTLIDYESTGNSTLKMIPGEEVTAFASSNMAPVHIGAIGISKLVKPVICEDVISTLQINIDQILEAGGIACINHPNFKWAFDHREMIETEGAALFEVYNASRGCNNLGGDGKFSTSDMWDHMLTQKKVIYGAATDDSHDYRDFAPDKHNPGRGWVVVRSESGNQDSLIENMRNGNFYSSSGVSLDDLESSDRHIEFSISQIGASLYSTKLIGENGRVLKEISGNKIKYEFEGNEGYVRAEVMDSDGAFAWTQPVFLS